MPSKRKDLFYVVIDEEIAEARRDGTPINCLYMGAKRLKQLLDSAPPEDITRTGGQLRYRSIPVVDTPDQDPDYFGWTLARGNNALH